MWTTRQAGRRRRASEWKGQISCAGALDAGLVDYLWLVIAAVVLGGGKRLFDGFERSLDLERLGVRRIRRLAETNL